MHQLPGWQQRHHFLRYSQRRQAGQVHEGLQPRGHIVACQGPGKATSNAACRKQRERRGVVSCAAGTQL